MREDMEQWGASLEDRLTEAIKRITARDKRIAELEDERDALSNAAITLIKWIDHTVPSWTPEVEKYKNKLEALAAKPATKLQSIAKEAPATKNPRDGVCGNHCEWWLVRDGKCALGYSSWQACKEAAGKGK